MMRHRFLMMAMLIPATQIWAADQPRVRPTRDVEIEYRTTGMPANTLAGPMGGPMGGQNAGAETSLTIHFGIQGNRMRVEMPNGHGYAIIDKDAGRMTMVMTEQRMYMEMPHDMMRDSNVMAGLDGAGATFNKTGADTVAGLKCTTYDTVSNDQKRQVCLTDDGVLLRIKGDDPNHRRELVAIRVTYVDQPASLFEPPAGFQKMEIPAMPGGMPPGIGGPGGSGMPARPPAR